MEEAVAFSPAAEGATAVAPRASLAAYLRRVVRQLVTDGGEPEVVLGGDVFIRPACAVRCRVHQRVCIARVQVDLAAPARGVARAHKGEDAQHGIWCDTSGHRCDTSCVWRGLAVYRAEERRETGSE